VMELAQAPEYVTSGMLTVGPEFATGKQMTKAVRRLMIVYPELAATFEAGADEYPALTEVISTLPTVTTDRKGVPMVRVPAGPFNMGSDASNNVDEQPVHEVYLDEYYIDQYEVTNDRYRACVDAGACEAPEAPEASEAPSCAELYQDTSLADHPVVCVSWHQAQSYCEWRGGHLPTEAQWEKAARGDDERTYPWGEGITEHLGNYVGDYNRDSTMPVDSNPAGVSPYGVYNMAGNVWEWVADWYYQNYYSNSPAENPPGPPETNRRGLRGGSWRGGDYYTRASYRGGNNPDLQTADVGLRCVGSAAGF
jgi:sulfatase modifying factor 1